MHTKEKQEVKKEDPIIVQSYIPITTTITTTIIIITTIITTIITR